MNDPAPAGPRNPFASLWPLDRSVAYLNHGSFGACPWHVLKVQAALRERIEREPFDFFVRHLPALLREAREALGAFLGAAPDDLAFVPNATAGVNAVLRSLRFEAGDEVLTTSHVYPACLRAAEYATSRAGARVVVAPVPFPIGGEDEVVSAVLAAVTPRTRLALLDHVTSPTALVFPVERLVAALSERGVDTLVDGAHAPGMVPLDLDRLGAAYTTGNAHKWLCTPKGAAFLHVRKDRQPLVHPAVISHAYCPEGTRFAAEFDWTGTGDPTAYLCVPEAIRFLGLLLPGGWPELMGRNRALALAARERVSLALGVPAPAPAEMVGSIASVPLPAPAPGTPAARLGPVELMDWFRERGVETCLFPWPAPGGKVVRVAAQLYNDEAQFETLAGLLAEAVGTA